MEKGTGPQIAVLTQSCVVTQRWWLEFGVELMGLPVGCGVFFLVLMASLLRDPGSLL